MPVAQKTSKNALHYQNWGGWFIDPELDPGAFELVPEWRRLEIIYRKAELAAGRTPTFEGMVAAGKMASLSVDKNWAAWSLDDFDRTGFTNAMYRGAKLLDDKVLL